MNGSNMQYLQRNLSIYEGYLDYVKDKYIQSLVIKMNMREKSELKKNIYIGEYRWRNGKRKVSLLAYPFTKIYLFPYVISLPMGLLDR
jgi:hypothetical protein